jgi:hypothetical protein
VSHQLDSCANERKGLLPEEWALSQCLFGEHLLSMYPDRTVALVESEKTAVFCAGFIPEYVWLATGGKTSLGNKLDVLSGRKVVAYPDVDAYGLWCERLSVYSNIKVSDYLQHLAGDNSSFSHMDLADLTWKAGCTLTHHRIQLSNKSNDISLRNTILKPKL